jgi:uncharacterized DUF497 family protein
VPWIRQYILIWEYVKQISEFLNAFSEITRIDRISSSIYNYVCTVNALNWAWDLEEAKKNLEKHKVSFELAERALGDPLCISVLDPYPGEERWRTLGSPMVDGIVVLYVGHTWPEDEGGIERIIRARKAKIHEKRDYEER